MGWSSIFTDTFTTHFWTTFNSVVSANLGISGSLFGALVPFVLFCLALYLAEKVLHMFRGAAEGEIDHLSEKDDRSQGSQNYSDQSRINYRND